MPLEDFLKPGENIRFTGDSSIEFEGGKYDLLVTDRRLLLYVRKGMVFKKDKTISENIIDIIDMSYEEKGLVSKKGIIKLRTGRKRLEFMGPKESMLAMYKELQTLL